MSAARKQRLEAHIAKLRESSVPGTAKRQASHWPLYAAVTGSALALSANAPVPGLNPALRNPTAAAAPRFTAGRTPFEFAQRPTDPGRSAGDGGGQYHAGF